MCRVLLIACYNEIGNPEQCALEIRVGQGSKGLARLRCVAIRGGHRVFDGTVAVKDFTNLLAAYILKAAIVEDALNCLTLTRRAMIEGVNDGEGGFAFAQIAGDGLAEYFFSRCEVQHIVDNLERKTDRTSVCCELFFLSLRLRRPALRQGALRLKTGRRSCGR